MLGGEDFPRPQEEHAVQIVERFPEGETGPELFHAEAHHARSVLFSGGGPGAARSRVPCGIGGPRGSLKAEHVAEDHPHGITLSMTPNLEGTPGAEQDAIQRKQTLPPPGLMFPLRESCHAEPRERERSSAEHAHSGRGVSNSGASGRPPVGRADYGRELREGAPFVSGPRREGVEGEPAGRTSWC
jgi:hypothetical protein